MPRRTIAIAAALSVLTLGSPLVIANANPLADNLFNSGVDKYKQGDYQGAIADYTKAIEINPQDVGAYTNRGIAKNGLKDYQGAIADYNKALEINPKDAIAYSNRGASKELIGDLKGACDDWRKAVDLGHQSAAEWVKKQCQASTSAQQMEWEKMLVGESAEADQAAAEGYSLRGEGVPDGVPFSIEGKPAPDDFVDSQCINEDDVREPCKLKVDRINKAIGIWTPPGRVSSRLSIFKGSCLDAGCVLQNPDYGYPEEYRGTTKVVSWSGEHGGLLLRQDHGYEFEVVPLTPFSF